MTNLEPSHLATLAQDYRHVLGAEPMPEVTAIETLLADTWVANLTDGPKLTFLGHCTEKTGRVQSGKIWHGLLSRAGFGVDAPQVGYCGMAGAYGHQVQHLETSEQIFDLS